MDSADTEQDVQKRYAPWNGALLVLFEQRPKTKAFLKYYIWVVVFAYPAIIVLANSLQLSFLPSWMKLWAPVTNVLSKVFPIFTNFEAALGAKGFGYRTQMIHHILTYEWVITIAMLVVLLVTVWKLTTPEWSRFAESQPVYRQVLALGGALVFFLASAWWTTVGFDLVRDTSMFPWHRSDAVIPFLGLFFGFGVLMAVMICGCFGALVVAWRSRGRQSG